MDNFVFVMSCCLELLQKQMTIYGFTFSWWDIFIYAALAGSVLKLLGGIFH